MGEPLKGGTNDTLPTRIPESSSLAARDHRTPSQVCEWLGSLTIGGVQAALRSWGGSFDVPAGLSASETGGSLCVA